MPSALERRLDRLAEALVPDDGDCVRYCADEAEAERLSAEGCKSRRGRPLCIVTGTSAVGPPLAELMQRIAEHGRRIHDRPAGPISSAYVWPRIWHASF